MDFSAEFCIDLIPASEAREENLRLIRRWTTCLKMRNGTSILTIIARVDGNRTRAAEIPGIDRKILREKLRKTEETPAS